MMIRKDLLQREVLRNEINYTELPVVDEGKYRISEEEVASLVVFWHWLKSHYGSLWGETR